jgi:drug/metabolite transporter (DMT)-like permease
MRRLRDGDWIAGAGGLALLAAMFLSWFSGASAWRAFSVLDVVLALLALVPLALVVLQATRASPSLPVALSVLTTVAGALAALLILYRIVNQPGPNDAVEVEPGAWIALAAAVATTAGGWRSMRDEAIPGARMPPIEDLPAPTP